MWHIAAQYDIFLSAYLGEDPTINNALVFLGKEHRKQLWSFATRAHKFEVFLCKYYYLL